jgi:hypothetical protein
MYQSLKTYSHNELQDYISNLDTCDALEKSEGIDVYFGSSLTNLSKPLNAASLAIPLCHSYELKLFDVLYKNNGFFKAIKLVLNYRHQIVITSSVKPSDFWFEYLGFNFQYFSITFKTEEKDLFLTFCGGIDGSLKDNDKTLIISKMSDLGFRTSFTPSNGMFFMCKIATCNDSYIDPIRKLLVKYVVEESLSGCLKGTIRVSLRNGICNFENNTREKQEFDEQLSFWQSLVECLDENYIPSKKMNKLELVYSSTSYNCSDWDMSKSLINSKPLEIPVGKLNDNGPRDYHIISKKILKDGYKLLVEHSKFPDAELPVQFNEADFEYIED